MSEKRKEVMIYILLGLTALAIGIYTQLPALCSQYIINDDVMQHTYWMNKFHDQGLFNDDIYVEFSNFCLPLGFKALYYIATIFVDPKLAGKIFTLILYVVSGVYLYKLGKLMQDRYTGLILFFLFICFPIHIDPFGGGLQRAFAYPLLITFLYYLFLSKFRACILILILQVLFYPADFMISYIALIFLLLTERGIGKEVLCARNVIGLFLPPTILGIFLIYKNYTKPFFLGNLTDIKIILANLDSLVYGRYAIFPIKNIFIVMKEDLIDHKFFPIMFIPLCAMFVLDFINKRSENFIKYKVIFAIFVSSIIMYYAASVVLLKLYLPTRYVEYSFCLIGLVAITWGLGFVLRIIRNANIRRAYFLVSLVAAGVMYGPSIQKGVGCPLDQRLYQGFFEYISHFPKEVVIAANPHLSDYISTFSERKTFLKYELSYPWFDKYARTVEKRILDFSKAYYSHSKVDIYKFCLNNNIDYMVVSVEDFPSFTLNNDQGDEIVKAKKRFAVEEIDESKMLYQTQDKKIFMIKADRNTLLD